MAMAATNWGAAAGAAEAERGLRFLRRQRVRALPVPDLEERPARLEVWEAMNEDRLRRNLTQDQYAELLGGSGSSLSRFRRVQGKLPKVMSGRLAELHPSPKWKRLLKALLVEDALHDGTLGAATAAD
jgi:hypothetical protein